MRSRFSDSTPDKREALLRYLRSKQAENLSNNSNKVVALQEMVDMVPRLRNELEQGSIERLGDYLDKGWEIKRTLANSISNSELDEIYKKARTLGATGGKVLGAGGGGFFLFSCSKPKQKDLIANLGLKCIPIRFDHGGATVVYRG